MGQGITFPSSISFSVYILPQKGHFDTASLGYPAAFQSSYSSAAFGLAHGGGVGGLSIMIWKQIQSPQNSIFFCS